MKEISKSVIKKDHQAKVDGTAMYIGDYSQQGMLNGRIVRSPYPHARIVEIKPYSLPEGYFTVDHRSVPGINAVHMIKDDTPIFAAETVEYIGDPVLMVVGPIETEVLRIANEIEVVYEQLPAILDIRSSQTAFFDYTFAKGDIEVAFTNADKIYEEQFETGYQEQAYLEPQGMIAEYSEGKLSVHGSLQCPYYVHGAVTKALGLAPDRVRVIQDVTGGGFGGKEDYPSIIACQVAVAAFHAGGKPVRVIFDRREDMEFTTKRHPSLNTYRVALKNGRVTAMDIDVLYNSGGYTTLSAVVLQRGIIASSGVYNVENLRVRGRAMKTNTVPTGAFRGFGAPQTFFSIEMMMNHIARDLGEEPLAFKQRHLVKQGDTTSTNGIYHFPVPLNDMITELEELSGYSNKRAAYNVAKSSRYQRGIGISLWFHGAGFTGSGERDHIKAVTRLHKTTDGRVEILASQTEIGQGIKTTLCKIVANELNIPLDLVTYNDPDTDRVPDSGPTVASRSLMTVGELLRRAAIKLRNEWKDAQDQTVEERFVEPDFVIPFDIEQFQGDAYPTYAWAASAVEVEVDTLTGINKVVGAWASFDVGTPIDYNIVIGQMEGGLLQGLGYASMEQMASDTTGRIRNNSFSDYIIPTSVDVPVIKVKLHIEEYPLGPYGGKGAGELPLVGMPAAYMAAIEQALNRKIQHIPYSAEDALFGATHA